MSQGTDPMRICAVVWCGADAQEIGVQVEEPFGILALEVSTGLSAEVCSAGYTYAAM